MPGYAHMNLIARLLAGGSVATLASPILELYDFLEVWVRIAGYAGSAIAQLQLNGDTGTTAYSNSVMEGNAAPVTQVATVAAGWKVATTAITAARGLIVFRITNVLNVPKTGIWAGSSASEVAATAPTLVQGAGEWANNAQINQITLDGGGQNLLTGTSMMIWGMM